MWIKKKAFIQANHDFIFFKLLVSRTGLETSESEVNASLFLPKKHFTGPKQGWTSHLLLDEWTSDPCKKKIVTKFVWNKDLKNGNL